MRMLTIKANPRLIFAGVIILTGVIVILLTFIGNHNGAAERANQVSVTCSTAEQRQSYITALGWEVKAEETEKQITIPQEFNEVYTKYNKIQLQQGFDLSKYKGKPATVYTYNVTNYDDNDNIIADLIVCNGELIAADLCDPSAKDGFLVALGKNNGDGKIG